MLDDPAVDDLAERDRAALDQRGVPAHRHLLLDGAHGQPEVLHDRPGDVHHQRFDDTGRETDSASLDAVCATRKCGQQVRARVVCTSPPLLTRVPVGGGDFSATNRAPGRIDDAPGQRRRRLRARRRRTHHADQREQQRRDDHRSVAGGRPSAAKG